MISFSIFYVLFFYLFGVILYDALPFSFLDEFLILVILLYALKKKLGRPASNKPLITIALVALFYMGYSVVIHSNTFPAILTDLTIQIKPYVAFFSILVLQPVFSSKDKLIARLVVVSVVVALAVIGFGSFTPGFPLGIYNVFGHPSRYATAVVASALLYLWASRMQPKDIFLTILILSLGLISGRSKFFGFYMLTTLLLLGRNLEIQMRFSLRNILIVGVLIVIIGAVSFSKLNFYFVEGSKNLAAGNLADESVSQHMFARPALYISSYLIFFDYFPFGSGFASFGTYASALPYSELYAKYGLDKVHGLTPDNPSFIADTFYPSLAQFGVVGLLLFIWFWILVLKKIKQIAKPGDGLSSNQKKNLMLGLLIVAFFIIESIADTTFTHNRGVFIMIILGLSLTEEGSKASLSQKKTGPFEQ